MVNVVEEIAAKLFEAYQTKQPIAFIREQYDLNEETAYAVQDAFVAKRCKQEQAEIAGYKISMTSADTQAIAQTNEPAYGTLLTTDLLKSGATVPLSSLFSPLIETEIVFVLTADLSPGAGTQEILEKSRLAAGIEVPDSRYVDWFPNFSLADLLCDNAATGLVVMSDATHALTANALARVEMDLFHCEQKIATGSAATVLDNPVFAISWLSRKLAQTNKILKKGMIVSSGTFISPVPVEEDKYKATFRDIGQVDVTFTDE